MAWTLLVVSTPGLSFAQVERFPVLDGYITSIASGTDLAVNGTRVVCSAKTQFHRDGSIRMDPTWQSGPYIGQPVKVFGKKDGKSKIVSATEIAYPYDIVPAKEGSGVIDRVLSADLVKRNQVVVRADGYSILIDRETNSIFTPPLNSMADITTNVWLEFKGHQELDGHIVATQAVFTRNAVDGREGRLRGKNEYDPAAVDPKNKQSAASKALLGVKVKRIPPEKDPSTQQRIDRIGTSLIPKYQLALPPTDPTRIQFRFQLVDVQWTCAVALPSGIILVPRRLVERMQNDAQLAEVLAYAMAASLEKRDYRDQPVKETLLATGYATAAGGLFVPGLGIGGVAGNSIASSIIERHDSQQAARVSLGLLQDAGYDIDQAPLAWWILASNKRKDLADIAMPKATIYLYQALGTSWKTGHMAVP